jgi:hypothetical protein
MGKSTGQALYVVLMIIIIVTLDVAFFRHKFRERLITNVLVVVLFGLFYLIVLRHK